jgi:phosphomannomutase
LTTADMLFIGDRLDEGGNDYPVKAMGVPCVAVEGWKDTAQYLRQLLARDVWPEAAALADEATADR